MVREGAERAVDGHVWHSKRRMVGEKGGEGVCQTIQRYLAVADHYDDVTITCR